MAVGVLPPTKEGIGAMSKLDQLSAEKGKKFDEICALVARELGYGELATIDAADRNHVEREGGAARQRVGRDDRASNAFQHSPDHAVTSSFE
jgi:hypothetical protein